MPAGSRGHARRRERGRRLEFSAAGRANPGNGGWNRGAVAGGREPKRPYARASALGQLDEHEFRPVEDAHGNDAASEPTAYHHGCASVVKDARVKAREEVLVGCEEAADTRYTKLAAVYVACEYEIHLRGSVEMEDFRAM